MSSTVERLAWWHSAGTDTPEVFHDTDDENMVQEVTQLKQQKSGMIDNLFFRDLVSVSFAAWLQLLSRANVGALYKPF